MRLMRKIALKLRWIGMLGASVWWLGVYVDQAWGLMRHLL
jgi:hypothetical protein